MTQFNPQYPGHPGAMPSMPPTGQVPQEPRRFPFFMGYFLWFSPALWRDAGRRWGGICFFYMLILLLISWAIVLGVFYPKVTEFGRTEVPKFAAKVPPIEIKDGVASADVPQPYIIKDPDSAKTIFVIDTTGTITEPPEVPSFLLTKDEFIVRDQNKVQTLPLKELPPMSINSGTVQEAFDSLVGKYWTVGYPTAVIVTMILRLVQMLIYGLIALAVASSIRPPLGFGGCMRLSAIAVTPVILLDTVLWAVGLPMGCMWWLLGGALEIVLLVFMVRANNDENIPAAPPGGFYPQPAPFPPQGYAPPGYAPPPGGYAPPPPPPPR